MPDHMRVARLVEVGKPLQVGEADKPIPGPRDVLVKVEACSLVPNTANLLRNSVEGFWLQPLPAVFGLDVSGTIEALGEHVQNLEIGDRVYVNPHLTCGTCHQCRRGRPDVCLNSCLRGYFTQSESGRRTLDWYPVGGLSQYLLSPDVKCAKVPESISLPLAARFGYIGTSFGALKKGGVAAGKTLLINGVTGTLGASATLIALGLGAIKILGIGRNPDRLKEISDISPRVVTRSSEEEGDLVQWILDQTDGLGVDALYDCLGVGGDANETGKLVAGAVKKGGMAVLAAGGAQGELGGTYTEMMEREVSVLGSFWFSDAEADEMIALMAAGVIDLSKYEDRVFKLDDINDAVECVANRPGGFLNVVVKPNV